MAAALAKATTERPASPGELAAKLGLSGKLSPEPTAPAPVPATPAPAVAAAPVVASLVATAPETTTEKAPEAPKQTALDTSKETPTPAETSVAAITGAAAVAAAASSSNAREPEPAAAVEPKIELPARGPGIKLPPSRLAGVAAAETERKAVDKPEEKPREKPLALDDDDRDVDSKVDADSEKYEDRAPSAKSSKLVFGALIILIIALAYLLNRPPKQEPKPAPGTPVNAQVTPAPSTPREVAEATPRVEAAAPKETGLVGEPVLSGPTPARPATPNVAKATPALPPTGTETVAPTGDPEKDYLNAIKQEQTAKAAVKDAEKALETKGKEITPIVKTGGELLTQRTKRADEVKAAEEAAQAARQAAEAKAKAAEDVKKAQADWEAANGPKLAAYDKASNDFKALEETLAVKKQQAEDAARAVAAADAARRDLTAKVQKEKERLAALKVEEDRVARAKKERDDSINAEIDNLRRALEKLQWEKNHPGEPMPASLTAPAAGTPTGATPGPVVGATPRALPIATPGPVVGSTPRGIPPPPPSPKPVPQTGIQNEFGTPSVPLVVATPTVVAVGATPTRVISSLPPATPSMVLSTPAPLEVKATPLSGTPVEASAGESSLGLKFVPVGDVAFCIWPTRLQDFDVFAKETGFRNNSWRSPGFRQGPDHPVVNVCWNDAIAFCKWLTERDRKKGVLTKDQVYRLPTDLEWSKAVGLPEETGKIARSARHGRARCFPVGHPMAAAAERRQLHRRRDRLRRRDQGLRRRLRLDLAGRQLPPEQIRPVRYGRQRLAMVHGQLEPRVQGESAARRLVVQRRAQAQPARSCRVSANPDSSTDNYGFRIVRASERSGRPR